MSNLATMKREAASGHIPALDGVRGLAIVAVILSHSFATLRGMGPLGNGLATILEGGIYGVDLFFVLSGFLITGILLTTRESPRYFTSFYGRRVLRIFPMYFLCLGAIAVGVPLLHRVFHNGTPGYQGPWWWYVTYLSNWKAAGGSLDTDLGHFWSLAVEEQFYLIWPLVVYLTPTKRLASVCGALAGLALAARCVGATAGLDWNLLYRWTPMRLDALALGALTAILYREPSLAPSWLRSPAVGQAGLVGFLSIVTAAGDLTWHSKLVQILGASCLAIAFSGLVLTAVEGRGPAMSRFLNQAWLRSAGKYSYSMYLLHGALIGYIASGAARVTRAFPALESTVHTTLPVLGILGSYAAARATWAIIEEPILRFKSRFPYDLPVRQAVEFPTTEQIPLRRAA